MLVPRRVGDAPGAGPVRRFSLARVGPTTVSALGADRFERMEEVAGMDDAARSDRDGYEKGDG